MRLRLSLSVDSRANLLPLNYHDLFSAWVYEIFQLLQKI